MARKVWATWSLRFWVALAMTLVVIPLVVSAIGGYLLLDRGVIAEFDDVAFRQRYQVAPIQQLRLLIWESVIPVDEFVDAGEPRQPAQYRDLRRRIDVEFADIHQHLDTDPEARALVERARDDWTAADRLAAELISIRRPPGDPRSLELMERFHGTTAASIDRLKAVSERLAGDIEEDHDRALLFYERSQWLAAIAGLVSAVAIALGVYIISRILTGSIDRLVVGAARFADGDRDHRIDVDIPPELHRVADEFNRMIYRIHESETALADLARRDALTRLLNRRAFDEALEEMYARIRRFGETGALMTIDIDHFKRINDTFGHSAGDDVLRTIARLMTAEVRPFDKIFRVGGEEFSVLLPGSDIAAAGKAAERLREVVAAQPVAIKDNEVAVTISVGVAQASENIDPEALVGAADAALYRAKEGGRNQVAVSET